MPGYVQIPKIKMSPLPKAKTPYTALALGGKLLGDIALSGKIKGLAGEAFEKPYESWQEGAEELAEALGVKDIPRLVSKARALRNQAFYSTEALTPRQHKFLKTKKPAEAAPHGVIVMGENAPLSILGHEMGHAAQQKARGPIGKAVSLRAQSLLALTSIFGTIIGAKIFKGLPGKLAKKLAKKPGALKRVSKLLSHKAAPYVSMTAGGLGTGYAMNYPQLAEEWGASKKSIEALRKIRGDEAAEKARKRLRKAYNTYQIAAAIPTIMGTLPAALPPSL